MPALSSDLNKGVRNPFDKVAVIYDVTCCTGSIPRELGNLSVLQRLYLSANKLIGESNVCLGVSGTFVVSSGAHVSNEIHREKRKLYLF